MYKRVLTAAAAAILSTGCATHQDWEPEPTFSMEGTFEGEITMYDPNQAPPVHPGWQVADSVVSTLGGAALPYLLMREATGSIQAPTVVEQPGPRVVRPEVVRPEIFQPNGGD